MSGFCGLRWAACGVTLAAWLLTGCDDPEIQAELDSLQQQISGEEPEPEPEPEPPPPEPKEIAPEYVAMVEEIAAGAQKLPAPFAVVPNVGDERGRFRGYRFDQWKTVECVTSVTDDQEMARIPMHAECRHTPYAGSARAAASMPIDERLLVSYYYDVALELHEGEWHIVRVPWAVRTRMRDHYAAVDGSAHREFCEYVLQRDFRSQSDWPAIDEAG